LATVWADVAPYYFEFHWDNRAVWALDLPVEELDRAALDWQLDLPFWSTRPPEPLFDLRPRAVLADPSAHARHAERIRVADLRHPLDVMECRGRLAILDGMHRLARLTAEGSERLRVRRVPRSLIPRILRS
jgi:hypothetical protein